MEHTAKKLAYSVAELAQVAGVGRTFVYGEINEGRLKLKKAGRRSLILSGDAAAWLASLPDFVRAPDPAADDIDP